jgi:hypothetical protein
MNIPMNIFILFKVEYTEYSEYNVCDALSS